MSIIDRSRLLSFYYIFKYSDGTSQSFEILLDQRTLNYIKPEAQAIPEWARLDYYRCASCINDSSIDYCPIAVNIAPIINAFKERSSYENAYVLVMTKQRDISKNTTIDEGLTAMLGIIMVTSGCPTLEKLKPLVRYHLPFANMNESVVRVVSMYLLIQLYRKTKGRSPDWDVKNLEKIYEDIIQVNNGVNIRLKMAMDSNPCIPAISNLNSMASLLPLIITDTFEEIEDSLSSYLKEEKQEKERT